LIQINDRSDPSWDSPERACTGVMDCKLLI